MIGIIGAGGLGRRHLQSLADLSSDVGEIVVVDPSNQALAMARDLYAASSRTDSPRVRYSPSLADLGERLEVVIVATSADVRHAVLDTLLRRTEVASLVLEKVLFQDPAEYASALTLLGDAGVKAWVNCPRRLVDPFRALPELFAEGEACRVTVHGMNWGLACNAVHMVDFVSLVARSTQYAVDTAGLVEALQPSKRAGFVEYFGELTCLFDTGTQLTLNCANGEATSLHIRIESARRRLELEHGATSVSMLDLTDGRSQILPFHMPPQSQLTSGVVTELVESGQCGLTPFAESAELHLPLIRSLLAFHNRVAGTPANTRLPIT